MKNKTFFCTRDVYLSVWFNIVIGHLRRPYSTHTAPMPVLTGSVHAHILTKPSRAGFAVIRLVNRARRGNVCLSSQGMVSYRSACPDRLNFEADSAAPWQRAPPLDHVQVAAVRAAWHESWPPLRAPRGGDATPCFSPVSYTHLTLPTICSV